MQRGGSFTSGQDVVRKKTFFQIKCPLEMLLSFLITNIHVALVHLQLLQKKKRIV